MKTGKIILFVILQLHYLFGDNISSNGEQLDNTYDLFDLGLLEAKQNFADAVIFDLTGDTLETIYQFENLFESIAYIDTLSQEDEFKILEYNQFLTAVIDYYQNKSITISQVETSLSVSMFRDQLNKYIYSQALEDLEYVTESIEVIDGHLPITYNQKVERIIKFFQNEGRKTFQSWLNRMHKYKTIILPILEEEDLPPEIFYLAMIESGLNPKAYSYAHASGIWQFISSTGKQYGLKKTYWIDERRDFIKSTYAASKYLKSLYKHYDDWYLAFAAYNCGQGRVDRAIKFHNSKDYWKLYRLPSQTKNYVPNIMAAIIIATNPEKYGFLVLSEPNLEWEEKTIDKTVSLKVISECSNIDIKTLQTYNPEIKQSMIPPLKNNQNYPLRLPLGYSQNFDSLFALVQAEVVEEIVMITHKIKRGDNISDLARKYGVRRSDIISINKIKNPNFIRQGKIIHIPTKNYYDVQRASIASTKTISYTVKRGDTLSELALRYKTSVKKLKKWNGLRNTKIKVGQKLKIIIN